MDTKPNPTVVVLSVTVLLLCLACSKPSATDTVPPSSPTTTPAAATTDTVPPTPSTTAATDPAPKEVRASAPAGKNLEGHDDACSYPNAGAPSSFVCEFDTDCAICHDGSNCGVIVNRAELVRRGKECERPDAAECEYSAPRCCKGRCTICGF